MSNYINKALLDSSPYKKQQDETKGLVNKWDKTGLLEGLNEDFQKTGMAVMLENQAKQLINEFSYTAGGAGGSSAGAGSEEWSGVALPLVRRIFGEIAAQEFVSVQPMNLPSGLVFYLDFKYGKTTAGGQNEGFGTNNSYRVPGGDVNSLQGKTGPNSPSGSSAPYGVGGLYGAGRYDYSINVKETAALTAAVDSSGASGAHYFTGSALSFGTDVNFNDDYSASAAAGRLWPVYVKTTGTIFTRPDFKSVRSWNIYSASDASNTFTTIPEFTTYDSGNGWVKFVVSGASAPVTGNGTGGFTVLYSEQPTEAARGDFEDATNSTGDDLSIPEVDIQLRSQAIVAKTRKLKAVWTPELAQDLNAYHSVDAEAELTSMLSEYISMEIDLEILDMLIADAVTTDYWSARSGYDYDAGAGAFTNTSFTGTRFEWWQTLVAKIQKTSNEIHRLTLRGGANFCVVSPKVATILESLPGYMSDTDGNQSQFAMGVSKVGAINSRFNVYKNPYMTENTILVGFRGQNFLETGAVYAPYVPLIMTPLVYDPSDFTPRKGVMTRYAKKMIRPEFYAKIHVADLDLI
jgi:hypothetical protein